MKKHWVFLGSMMVVAVVGCGNEDERSTSQRGYRDANVVEQASLNRSESPGEAVPAVSQSAQATTVSLETGPVASEKIADSSTPPDLLAKASKEIVTRGETVEVVAEGSADVIEMTLTDGYGITVPMVFDAPSSTWRASYRVPLSMHLDRLGLAITAKNDENRWRRVWVFLNLPENAAKADSCQ